MGANTGYDIVNGVHWTADPATGQRHEAPLGPNPNYYYNANTGVSVNSAPRPRNAFNWRHPTPVSR